MEKNVRNTDPNDITVALVDDHILLRNALATLIDSFENCRVIWQASNAHEMIQRIRYTVPPQVIILDLNMPVMDGHSGAMWLKENIPQCLVLMLTMYDSDLALIRLLQAGVRGFLKKDIHPSELKFAIRSVTQSGYYYSHQTSGKLANLFRNYNGSNSSLQRSLLNEQEIEFLRLCGTEFTYKEIAQSLHLNLRAVDNLRDHLFEKLEVKSRVGLAMYAMRHGIVSL